MEYQKIINLLNLLNLLTPNQPNLGQKIGFK